MNDLVEKVADALQKHSDHEPDAAKRRLIRILFPGASITVLQLMEHGDLQRVLPDWIERLIGAYEATPSATHYIARCRTAWNDLIHEYDLAVEAEARAKEAI